MRLFVAADLPARVRAELGRHGRELASAGGWRAVDEDALHVTLAFLGERDESQADAVARALRDAAGGVEGLRLGGDLRLPPRRPRVAAVELEDPRGRLAALQAAVAAVLAARDLYAPERRRFLPHVTVARRRTGGEPGEVGAPRWSSGAFPIAGVTLYVSRLSPRGARYEALARFPG